MFIRLAILWLSIVVCPAAALPKAVFEKSVSPFLSKHCTMCHNAKVKMAEVNLEQWRDSTKAMAERDGWQDVLAKLRNGEMPPPGRTRPTATEMEAVTGWIDEQISRIDKQTKPDPGRVTARRLNKTEYNNTIRDLLAVNFRPADDFPDDDAGYGFDNIGDVLTLSPVLMEKYLTAAERISRMAISSGKTPKATLERYTIDKVKADVLGGALTVPHVFPVYADYELSVRIVDRRRDITLPPVTLIFQLDGKEIKRATMQPGQNVNRLLNVRIPVQAGERKLRALPLGPDGKIFKLPEAAMVGDPSLRDVFIDYVEVKGPFANEKLGKAESHKRIFVCEDQTPECARKIVAPLAYRAWRRPVSETEVSRLAQFVTDAMKDGDGFAQGVQVALQAILVSPNFLFRIERNTPGQQHTEKIGAFELASRLSYFLWSSMPDDELLGAAESKEILKHDGMGKQLRRMLADAKAESLVENFAGQWLQLRNLESAKPDPVLFKDFDEELRQAMDQETRLLFAALLRENRSVLEFLDTDYTFLNARLAEHYGIAGVEGDQFRKVPLTGNQRGGVLTQASVLTVSSYPTRTSPVLRGKWILENILGTPPPPPPPDVPELKTETIGVTESLRSQLQKHRASPSCSVCHNKMDTLGFSLEHYDAIGRWRANDGNIAIDSSGTMNGVKFEGAAEVKKIILDKQASLFVKCLTEKLLTYSLGRGLEKYDRAEVTRIVSQASANGHKFQGLLESIVESLPFQMRRTTNAVTDIKLNQPAKASKEPAR